MNLLRARLLALALLAPALAGCLDLGIDVDPGAGGGPEPDPTGPDARWDVRMDPSSFTFLRNRTGVVNVTLTVMNMGPGPAEVPLCTVEPALFVRVEGAEFPTEPLVMCKALGNRTVREGESITVTRRFDGNYTSPKGWTQPVPLGAHDLVARWQGAEARGRVVVAAPSGVVVQVEPWRTNYTAGGDPVRIRVNVTNAGVDMITYSVCAEPKLAIATLAGRWLLDDPRDDDEECAEMGVGGIAPGVTAGRDFEFAGRAWNVTSGEWEDVPPYGIYLLEATFLGDRGYGQLEVRPGCGRDECAVEAPPSG